MHTKQDKEQFRQEMRQKPTAAENKFRGFLINNKIRHNFQKIRQYYIVDFWLKDYPYIIEIDGGYHQTEEQKAYDRRRDDWLEKQYHKKVIRVRNEDVYSKKFLVSFFKDLFLY